MVGSSAQHAHGASLGPCGRGQSCSLSVGRSVGRLIDPSVGRSGCVGVGELVGVGGWVGRSWWVGRSVGRWVGGSVGRWVGPSVDGWVNGW